MNKKHRAYRIVIFILIITLILATVPTYSANVDSDNILLPLQFIGVYTDASFDISFKTQLDKNKLNTYVYVAADSLGNIKVNGVNISLREKESTIVVSPPSGGWSTGKTYYLVLDANSSAIGKTSLTSYNTGANLKKVVSFTIETQEQYTWRTRNLKSEKGIKAIATNEKGLIVAVGDQGLIKTSTDMKSWNTQDQNINVDFNGIAWGKSRFVIVGNEGNIFTSTDGVSWKKVTVDFNGNIYDITWAMNRFIAVGRDGVLLYSSDGLKWSRQKLDTKYNLSGIAYNGQILAVCTTGGSILSSKDGNKWIVKSTKANAGLNDIIWNDGVFTAVGSSADYEANYSSIYCSVDGENWKDVSPRSLGTLTSIAYKAGSYIVFGQNFGAWFMLASNDGVNYEKKDAYFQDKVINIGETNNKVKVIGANNLFVASYGTEIITSENGINWSGKIIDENNTGMRNYDYINDIAWNGDNYIAVGGYIPQTVFMDYDDAKGIIYKSRDGVHWDTAIKQDLSKQLNQIMWTGKEFLALGSDIALTSIDGIKWSECKLYGYFEKDKRKIIDVNPRNNTLIYLSNYVPLVYDSLNNTVSDSQGRQYNLENVEYMNGGYVTKGEEYATLTVFNFEGLNGRALDVAVNGNNYVAVGKYGLIASSKDGETWEVISGERSGYDIVKEISFNGKSYVEIVDERNSYNILTSLDGLSWKDYKLEENFKSLEHVVTNGDYFIAYREDKAFVSKDGIEWVDVPNDDPTLKYIKIDSVGKTFYGLTKNERGCWIYTSTDGLHWEKTPLKNTYTDSKFYNHIISDGKTIVVYTPSAKAYSTDGINWTEKQPLDDMLSLTKILWIGNGYVGVSSSGIYFSTDGFKWNRTYNSGVYDAAWDGKKVVAITYEQILSSSNGYAWEEFDNINAQGLKHIIYNGKEFIAINYVNEHFSSKDGVSWSADSSVTGHHINNIIWDGNRYVAFTKNSIWISDSGEKWVQSFSKKTLKDEVFFYKVIWNGFSWLAADNNGTIYYSKDATKWDIVSELVDYSIPDHLNQQGKTDIRVLKWDGSKYIAVCQYYNGKQITLVSKDGKRWFTQ